jgi:hypothetical protein
MLQAYRNVWCWVQAQLRDGAQDPGHGAVAAGRQHPQVCAEVRRLGQQYAALSAHVQLL